MRALDRAMKKEALDKQRTQYDYKYIVTNNKCLF